MCKFCEEYNLMQEMATQSEIPLHFSAALLDHLEVNGDLRGKTTHYMKDGVGFPLKFCPECGKNLED